jgi:hypothetical protein
MRRKEKNWHFGTNYAEELKAIKVVHEIHENTRKKNCKICIVD